MNVIKFPHTCPSRRVDSKKPPRSRAAAGRVPASIVDLSEAMAEAPSDRVDKRKLRGSPLRGKVPQISFAVTIAGKMFTADLRGEPLPCDAAGWLEELQVGAAAARFVADELDKARERLLKAQAELPSNLIDEAPAPISPA